MTPGNRRSQTVSVVKPTAADGHAERDSCAAQPEWSHDQWVSVVSSDPPPRVFISHASEDKARFVLPFAEMLRQEGIDAWLDRWEMLPGDSLVRKIFSEGLSSASAVVVVLSRVSIAKPWVAEELDAAVVKRINEDSKLIPIVLDSLDVKTEVPVSVRHLLLEYVPDTSERDEVVRRVIRSIFGLVERPPLGPPPLFAGPLAVRIPGLDRVDSLVLRMAGAEAVRDFGDQFDTARFVATARDALGLSEVEVVESLQVLEADGHLEIGRTLAQGLDGMRRFSITFYGLEIYLRAYEADYPRFEQTVLVRIAEQQGGIGTERDIVEAADVPPMVIRHLLDLLASNGDLRLSKPLGGSQGWRFYDVSPRLRRRAAQ